MQAVRLLAPGLVAQVLLWAGTLGDTANGAAPPRGRPRPARVLSAHDATVVRAAFTRDGKKLAVATYDMRLTVWDVSAGKVLRQLPLCSEFPDSLAFSPDGRRLAVADSDELKVGEPGELTVWDVATGKRVYVRNRCRYFSSLVFSPDGKLLVSMTFGRVDVWDARIGKELRSIKFKPQSPSFAVSPDGKRLAIIDGSRDEDSIRLYDVRTGKKLLLLEGFPGVACARFSPDGKSLTSLHVDGKYRRWHAITGKCLCVRRGPRMPEEFVHGCMQLSPDGRWVASDSSAADSGVIKLWDLRSGREVWSLPPRANGEGASINARVFEFSPDGRWLATATADRVVEVWDLRAVLKAAR